MRIMNSILDGKIDKSSDAGIGFWFMTDDDYDGISIGVYCGSRGFHLSTKRGLRYFRGFATGVGG